MQEGREEVGGRAEGDDEKWQEGIEGQGIHGLFKELNLSIEHGIEVILMFLYKMKPILVLSFIVFLQIENEYTDIKRRVELETNEIRDKQQVRRSYTYDEDVHDNSIYNDDGFRILMMVLEYWW